MLLIIAILLLLFWIAGLFAHIAGGLIHILLVVALVVFVLHFIRGGKGA
ncbi:MAG: lmo0937 family membrane protein [Chthoniobacterales bacterium]